MLDLTSSPPDFIPRKDGMLHAEGGPLSRIAQEVGTPVYVYSAAALRAAARSFAGALAPSNTRGSRLPSRRTPMSPCCGCSPIAASAQTSCRGTS